jgi:NH3-dependent NAD+ synthetase
VLKQHQAILNWHNAIINTIQQQQPAAGLIDDARLNKRELLLRACYELLDGLVAVLGCPCGG